MLIDFLVVIVALLSGDIASVLSVLGATTNPFICFLLPAFFVCKIGTKNFHVYKTVAVCLAIFFSCFSGMSLVFQLQDGF
jgi:amino acid permease